MKLDGLNDMQKRAVKRTDGPVLVIAGAGSGKTRVLTHRIAYLIDECEVNPFNILAITFTNKAASEMKERVEKINPRGNEVWVSTFHSMCVRILRRFIDRLGFDNNFTIYDTDDQKSVIKEVCKKLNIDTKMLKERTIMNAISSAKDEMVSPDEMLASAGEDYNEKRIANAYKEYQKILKINNALDFDDLIFKTVELFMKDEEVLLAYQERFRYIMVDEYQDTNTVQFNLVKLLASRYGNLCVVGDDDQSIYKFRGANIWNILNFEKAFPGAKVIKLEQNYRSTQNILNAANEVIKNNRGRKDKTLWTANGEGDKINFYVYEDGYKEAEGVAESISGHVRDGWGYNEMAILYRTNAQSRLLEEKLLLRNIPYRIYGGVNFYQRKEIKDILAYLKTIDNGLDGQAVKRIINVPKRGIGATTIERIQKFADYNDMSFWDALCNADQIPDIGRSYKKLEPFVTLIQGFKAKSQFMSIRKLTEMVISDTRYIEALEENETKEEVAARKDNIDELINKIVSYEDGYEDNLINDGVVPDQITDKYDNIGQDNNEQYEQDMILHNKPTLSGFLEEVSLIADIDNLDQSGNQVMLMTLHSAKGLEFPIVYLTGLEDGLFPSYMTIMSEDPSDVEEERRLCYVGITRAMKELNISCAKTRMIRGDVQMNKVSRFVKEIPQEYLNIQNHSYSSRSKISFGGDSNSASSGKFDFRANAKAALGRYGSGNVTDYSGGKRRIKIGNANSSDSGIRPSAGRVTNYGSTYSNLTGKSTNYSTSSGTNYGSAYASANKAVVKNVSQAQTNDKVGFGKKFPMDIFDLGRKKEGNGKAVDSGKNIVDNIMPSGLGYKVGDAVSHVKFGNGKVMAIEKTDRDYMVTVDFDGYGVKKMLSMFAKLKKQ